MEFWNQILIKTYQTIKQEKLSCFNHKFFHRNHKDSSRDTDTKLQLEHQGSSTGHSHFVWLSGETPEQIYSVFTEIMYDFWFLTWIPSHAVTRAQLAYLTPSKQFREKQISLIWAPPTAACPHRASLQGWLQSWHHSGQHSWSAAGRSRKQITSKHMHLAALPYHCFTF